MNFKIVVMFVSVILLISLTIVYFVPFNTINFGVKSGDYNFSAVLGNESIQFYPNMRFSSSAISYRISDCPLQKQDDMKYAFRAVEDVTPLAFYPVINNEEVFVTCQDENIVHDGLFIAGEGGPTNIIVAGEFNIILHGDILLIRESVCENPNVAIHELFHVLGFGHSTNPENIMYKISGCDQIVGQDMIQEINRIYSVPSLPDLAFEDVSATISGRFLKINITVKNIGLNDASNSTVTIYANEDVVKEFDLSSIQMGSGIVTTGNIFIPQINVEELELVINNNFNEISKDNNKIKLEIK